MLVKIIITMKDGTEREDIVKMNSQDSEALAATSERKRKHVLTQLQIRAAGVMARMGYYPTNTGETIPTEKIKKIEAVTYE